MVKGLGAYPDQVWYDPQRPSWLPYWLDDLTESTRKYSTAIVGNPSGVEGGAISTDILEQLTPSGDTPVNSSGYLIWAIVGVLGFMAINSLFFKGNTPYLVRR